MGLKYYVDKCELACKWSIYVNWDKMPLMEYNKFVMKLVWFCIP